MSPCVHRECSRSCSAAYVYSGEEAAAALISKSQHKNTNLHLQATVRHTRFHAVTEDAGDNCCIWTASQPRRYISCFTSSLVVTAAPGDDLVYGDRLQGLWTDDLQLVGRVLVRGARLGGAEAAGDEELFDDLQTFQCAVEVAEVLVEWQ